MPLLFLSLERVLERAEEISKSRLDVHTLIPNDVLLDNEGAWDILNGDILEGYTC
jgi:hypothetical protein